MVKNCYLVRLKGDRTMQKSMKRYGLLGVGAIVVFNILFLLFYNLLKTDCLWPYASVWEGGGSLLRNMVPSLLLVVSDYLIVFYLWKILKKTPGVWVKLPIDTVLACVAVMLVNALFLLVMRPFYPDIQVDMAGTILFAVAIFMCVEIAYYIAQTYEMQRKREAAKQEALTYKYNLLNAQVNPHFLFNSLNNLLSLIKSDPDGAYAFTRHLSRLYRYVLTMRDKSRVLLSEELDFMRQYVAVLSIRYNHTLTLDLQGEEQAGDHYVLPLVLQLLMENIAKHNEISTQKPMTVTIRIEPTRITVTNPIHAKPKVSSNAFGLKYIQECYRLQGGTVSWQDDGDTFRVTLSYLDL